MGKRILETTLPNNYMDGEVLYGSELNKIVGVLRSGVNVNKEDIDKLLLGEESDFVFTTKDIADAYLLENTPETGQYALVMSGGEDGEKIDVYKFDGAIWELQVDEIFSIFNAYRVSKDFQGRLYGIDEALLDITNGVTAFKKVKYDINPPAETLGIGETRWNDVAGTLETRLSADVYLLHSQEALFKCGNISGKDIPSGTAVYISGASGGSPNFYVDKADNINLTKATRMIGLATEEIDENSSGYVCFSGIVNGVNTASFNVGDMLYLSTNGTLTNVRPSGLVVEVGIVIRKHSTNGAVAVSPRYYPRLDDLSNVNFTGSAEGDVAIRLANGTYANYNLTNKLNEIDGIIEAQDGRLGTNEVAIYNLESGTTVIPTYELKANKNVANGYVGLDNNEKIPLTYLYDVILGQLEYAGSFNPNSDYPTQTNALEPNRNIRKGDYFIANANGTISGVEYHTGDWAIRSASDWQKIDNTDAVASVNGKIGIVNLTGADINVSGADTTTIADKITAIMAAINDRYTKSEVYNKTEMDNIIEQIKALYDLEESVLYNGSVGTIHVDYANITGTNFVIMEVETEYTPDEETPLKKQLDTFTITTDTLTATNYNQLFSIYNKDFPSAVYSWFELYNNSGYLDCYNGAGNPSTNKFNKYTVLSDHTISSGSGTPTPNAGSSVSDFIEVSPSQTITVYGVLRITAFDIDKSYVAHFTMDGSIANTKTMPSGAKYVRLSLGNNRLDTCQMNIGDTLLPYEPYGLILDPSINLKLTAYKMKPLTAENISYDNSLSGLTAENTQDAIDELEVSVSEIVPITPEKTTFFKIGKNLFNKETRQLGARFSNQAVSDAQTPHTDYDISDFIKVEPNTEYYFPSNRGSVWFDENKTYISGGWPSNAASTSPSNAKYVRIAIAKADIDTFQFEKGSEPTTYEPYSLVIDTDYILFKPDENSIEFKHLKDGINGVLVRSKNLFNKYTRTLNARFRMPNLNDEIQDDNDRDLSDYIEVEPNTNYFIPSNRGKVWFDAEHNYISGIYGGTQSETSPSNAKYLRVAVYKEDVETFQIEEGTEPTSYEPYIIINPAAVSGASSDGLVKEFVTPALEEARIKTINENGFSFIAMTDTHNQLYIPHMIEVIKTYYEQYGNLDCVMHNGDIVNGNILLSDHKLQLLENVKRLQKIDLPFLIAIGNHDANGQSDNPQNLPMLDYMWSSVVLKPFAKRVKMNFDSQNQNSRYYYTDWENQKIRVITLDAVRGNSLDGIWGFSDIQVQWLGNEALDFSDKPNKNDWSVIIQSHMPSRPEVNFYESVIYNGAKIENILKAFVDGSVAEGYDFTSQGQMEVIMWLNGHGHLDILHKPSDLPYHCVMIANGHHGERSMPDHLIGEDYVSIPDKVVGTINEFAFDIFNVDRTNRKVTITRVGAGEDREFTY